VKWSRRALTVGVVAFQLAPLLVVAVVSLNSNRYMDFPPRGLSMSWYGEMVADTGWRNAILSSLFVAVTSAALAVVIALPLAYALRTYRIRLAPVLYTLGILPCMLPPVISALGALVFWNTIGHIGQIENVIVAHAIFFSTLPLITIAVGMENLDPSLPEAAQSLGASPRTTFRTITLPLLLPSVITGYAAAFVLSLNEYIIAFLVAGYSIETLPIKLFNSLRYGFTPTIAAVAVTFMLVAATIFTLFAIFGSLLRYLGADPNVLERAR
jgi:putative spermidine/putrescine transport system permease protein